MRAALISLAGQPRQAATSAPLALAGKTLARRQLDFALATGCESVIVLGDGGSAEAIALRHVAEAAGARFVAIRDSHGLLGAVRTEDELLALAPGLLPEAATALDAPGKGKAVLVLPAGTGVAAGFERIDLERAWAGALVVGGAQVECLSGLPADIEPSSALARIALQARVSEKRLPEELLADGSWAIVTEAGDLAASEKAWLRRHLPSVGPLSPSQWLAHRALRPWASRLLAARRSLGAMLTGTLAALAGSVIAARFGPTALGFALIPPGAVMAQMAIRLARLQDSPFGSARRFNLPAFLPWLVDGAIFASAVFAIEGSWIHRLFPPLVLMAGLHAVRPADSPDWTAFLRDRGFLAALFAIGAGFGLAESAIMLVSLALIALNFSRTA